MKPCRKLKRRPQAGAIIYSTVNILDTNIFNRLLDGQIAIAQLPLGQYVATHIQLDEIERTPDPERRAELHAQFASIIDEVTPTESFVLDFSRLDMARLGDAVVFEQLRDTLSAAAPQRFTANTNDALIGEAAINNGYTLVTADRELASIVRRLGGDVIEFK